ncbi:hypothetical protein SARC_03998 [Sphaeroforma arctica JP610]|uniref:Uncharacterized protein n=1 Tax=Sphaeroforma arctica JP610 TaxID=667725 RepID=A0A0L0G4F6_9EUKA|nr:hypothetical protein SARC_03998 [Sphaeroforma arctica JP610]KNC83774.1 hypothetical protein SARC_03998 [Sphaeroforma arctica JP610]|eukprot:XP_014157676.1 hypothetical protein SARC_03998 [Sphaeroforma arctica JP610]
MLSTQANLMELMEAQLDQMANNAANDIIPKMRAESDRKLRSVRPDLPNNLQESSLEVFQPLKKV